MRRLLPIALVGFIFATSCSDPQPLMGRVDGYTWYQRQAPSTSVTWHVVSLEDMYRICRQKIHSGGLQACAYFQANGPCHVYSDLPEWQAKYIMHAGRVSVWRHEVEGHCAGKDHVEAWQQDVV